jgi:hypothetical protein
MKRSIFLIIVISVHLTLSSQQRTHMPYSVYGLGDLTSKGFARNLSMGRTGIGTSSPYYLNNLNPASYHKIDSVSFFFDFGLSGNFVKYRTTNSTQKGNDINIGNLAIGFGITRNWSASFGIAPYSSVGYKIETTEIVEGSPNEEFEVSITGNGGLNQFYWNNSYELFDHISLGVNFTYLFGNIESTETVRYSNITTDISNHELSYLKRLYADFGIQGYFPVNKNLDLVIGGVFGQNHKIKKIDRISVANANGSVINDEINDEGTFDLPLYAGAGLSVVYKNSLTLAADYIYQDWSSTPSGDTKYKYRSNNIFRFGAELIPGRYSKLGYLGSIAFRIGAYYEESYLQINTKLIPEYGLTAGVGLPFLQNRTSVNVSYNYGVKGMLENHLVKENYHSLMFSLTLHDWWFLKRKID